MLQAPNQSPKREISPSSQVRKLFCAARASNPSGQHLNRLNFGISSFWRCFAHLRKIDVMTLHAVSSAISSTLVLLLGEVKLLQNVRIEVASIKAELESVAPKRCRFKSETRKRKGEKWVKQVRAIPYQIEDVMNEYTLQSMVSSVITYKLVDCVDFQWILEPSSLSYP